MEKLIERSKIAGEMSRNLDINPWDSRFRENGTHIYVQHTTGGIQFPGRAKRGFFYPQLPDRLWRPLNFLFTRNGYGAVLVGR
jgi:hypothetical protein